MSALGQAASDFLRLQAEERTHNPVTDQEEKALKEATDRTDVALDRLLDLHAESGAQAAIKLSAAASHYPGFGGGMRDSHLAVLVSECVRFLTAGDLKADAA